MRCHVFWLAAAVGSSCAAEPVLEQDTQAVAGDPVPDEANSPPGLERSPFYFEDPPPADLTPQSVATMDDLRAQGEALFRSTSAQASFVGRVQIGASHVEPRVILVDGETPEELEHTFYAFEVLNTFKGDAAQNSHVRVFACDGSPPSGDVVAFAVVEDGDLALLQFLPVVEGNVQLLTTEWTVAEFQDLVTQEGQP